MDTGLKVIEKDRVLGGYTIAVKDDWVYKIKRIHVSESEKDQFLEKFGETIVTYNEFYEWYRSIKKRPL